MGRRNDIERDGSARMPQVATALKHSTRQQALEILNLRDASCSEIARAIDEPVANVTYHLKILVRLGVVERVEERPGGSAEHVYRAVAAPILRTGDWDGVPATTRQQVEQLIVDQAVEDWSASRDAGLLDEREDRHLSRTHLELDEQAWHELADELDDLLARAHAKQVAARDRLADGERGGRRVTTALMLAHFPAKPVL